MPSDPSRSRTEEYKVTGPPSRSADPAVPPAAPFWVIQQLTFSAGRSIVFGVRDNATRQGAVGVGQLPEARGGASIRSGGPAIIALFHGVEDSLHPFGGQQIKFDGRSRRRIAIDRTTRQAGLDVEGDRGGTVHGGQCASNERPPVLVSVCSTAEPPSIETNILTLEGSITEPPISVN